MAGNDKSMSQKCVFKEFTLLSVCWFSGNFSCSEKNSVIYEYS